MSPMNNTPKNYWRSLPFDHHSSSPETAMNSEETKLPVSRRDFLRIMGASVALASFTGCRRPVEKIVPYVKQPEETIPGIPLYYATTMMLGEDSNGIIVESHEGKPNKIEGNSLHPSSMGKSNAWQQAAILSLYDPDRSQGVIHRRMDKSWENFTDYWRGEYNSVREKNGKGLAFLSEAFCSPSQFRMMQLVKKNFPEATWATFDPISNENIYRGIKAATGKAYRPMYFFDQAEVILSIDADFLQTESGNVIHTHRFSSSRHITDKRKMSRLYCVESMLSTTGGMADHRLRLRPSEMLSFVLNLADELRKNDIAIPGVKSPSDRINDGQKWIEALAEDLIAAKIKSLIVGGHRQPPEVHAVIFAINNALGNQGKTISYVPVEDTQVSDRESLLDLVKSINEKKVSTLIILGGNPVYNAPVDTQFSTALKSVPTTIHHSFYVDETSETTHWHLPQSHFLESWGDARAADGTWSIVQPLISPLYPAQTTSELLYFLATGKKRTGHEITRETLRSVIGEISFEKKWRRSLHDGVVKGTQASELSPKIQEKSLRSLLDAKKTKTEKGIELLLLTSPAVYDGRFANNGWLQELPDTVTKLVWDNAAFMSMNLAKSLGVLPKIENKIGKTNYNIITISHRGETLDIPAFVVPGHAEEVVSVYLGYGRSAAGKVGTNVGANGYRLSFSDSPYMTLGVELSKVERTYKLATTQSHHSMEGRPLIREAELSSYQKDKTLYPPLVKPPYKESPWTREYDHKEGPQWGMTIDLNLCTGCNACIIACQSENNIPIVGKEQADYGREMHWIRIDRYFSGDDEKPQMVSQPVPCMHCENAPCEQVCPVQATNHNKEGLNVMVYNRCIGTRYCSNNCPYKVRRFNFFNYTKHGPETRIRGKESSDIQFMSQNPDVTVRSRGVMEKCTYCLQRVNEAKIKAKKEKRTLRDGDVVPACQQSCPAGAIAFGDILSPDSHVSRNKKDERNYVLLGELYVKPRTSYLGKIRNPNPVLGNS